VETLPGLVGREAVLREIRTALDEAAGGRGRLLLLTGDPGMGKSAVLLAAAGLAEARSFAVHRGQCVSELGVPPLWPWTQVLRSMAADGSDLDPWLVRHLIEVGGGIGAEEPAAPFRLYDAVASRDAPPSGRCCWLSTTCSGPTTDRSPYSASLPAGSGRARYG
jgi:energy-coupling factor transporter ATP-binding protein EcfA2